MAWLKNSRFWILANWYGAAKAFAHSIAHPRCKVRLHAGPGMWLFIIEHGCGGTQISACWRVLN